MTKRTRRNHAPAFKAKVTLAALKGEKTLPDLTQLYDVHPNQITTWKAQLAEGAAGLFGGVAAAGAAPAVDLKSLHAKFPDIITVAVPASLRICALAFYSEFIASAAI